MRHAFVPLLALLLLPACAARSEPLESSLLRLVTEPRELTLCEGMRRHVAVSVSWAGSERPDVGGLPEITWLSPAPEVARVDGASGGITGVGPGSVRVVVHGRLGSALGRAVLPVTVRAGRWDEEQSRETGRLVCRPV